jgi:signal transduction histidine kinase
VDVSNVLNETLSLLNWEAKENNIVINRAYPDNLRVLATDSEMRMASLNMAQNAFHAMPDGGELRISAEKKDDWIEIYFEDQGVGIHPEDIDRIFDPFFSRRADGNRGTGLGLSITRTIVENYGGAIIVKSTLKQGSRFTIRLPDADAMETPAP